jgi:ComF family protein
VNYPEGLVRCRAVGVHDGDLASLIHHFKYHDRPMLAGPLAKVMADYLIVRAEIMNDLKFDAIVPVPLHPSRERKRGYNQSERLSRELGQILQVPVGRSLVRRTRNTKSQVGKHRDERLKNLENAFLADAEQCNGKVVLLVDDVTTTGTTMSECASALLSAGAVKVYSIALAAG